MQRSPLLLGICLVSLTACVPAVLSAVGTTGVVVAQERTAGQAVDDTAIWTHIKHLYLQQNAQDLLAGVNVEVIEGRVHLTGKVRTPETRIDAVRLAWQPEGVKEVINEIQVTDASSLKDMATDEWLGAQVKSRLLLEKGIRSINYSTDVVNRVAYIMGIALDEEELDKVTNVARSIKGIERVVSHVRLRGVKEER